MLEIEMKFAVEDFQPILDRIKVFGPAETPTHEEIDQYFNAPDRDFARTQEALRIRTRAGRSFVTYKGPRQPGPTKTRTELEIPLSDQKEAAHEFSRLLQLLGYRPVARVKKYRSCLTFHKNGFDLTISLDYVQKVGTYIEVEILCPEESKNSAQQTLLQVCQECHLVNSEPRSYLELFLAKNP